MRRICCLKNNIGCFVACLILLICHPALCQTSQHLNLLALGDWGLESPDRQQVADAMANFADHSPLPIDCALSLGDNFYVPLTSANDPAFTKLFENTYDAKRLNFPFLFSLATTTTRFSMANPAGNLKCSIRFCTPIRDGKCPPAGIAWIYRPIIPW